MDIWIIILRTVLMYFVVFAVMRLMGKREIGKLSVFDLVISIMIAEIAIFIIEDPDKPLLDGIAPLLVLVIIQISLAYLMLKNEKLRRWFDGKPSMLIENGHINREEMRKQKYNLDDLALQLRMKDVTDIKDVEFAILETNGSLSVFTKADREAETGDRSKRNEDARKTGYGGLPLSLILDGKVQDEHLELIQQSRRWLKEKLREKGIDSFDEVFYCNIDRDGNLFIERKL